MKKLTAVLLVVLGVSFVSAAALANYGDNNKLSGYVKVKGTLKPIGKASVKLYSTGGSKKDSDKTSSKGKYSFKDLSERKYVIRVKATGFRSPKDAKKTTVSYTVKVDGSTTKNVYLVK